MPVKKVKFNLEVTLLNTANYFKAFEPYELIESKKEGSYGFKTLLEWCIVGHITNKINERNQAVSGQW